MNAIIDLENKYVSQHYGPLPVVLVKGRGCHVWDHEGKEYLDFMSAYSAVSHGHAHPRLVKALTEQANKIAIMSKAYYSENLGPFLKDLCEWMGQDKALPMNTGAEGVETAIKAARKWAYTVKGVPDNQAEIIACNGNFHGRTTTIVSFSSEHQYKNHFGPFAPGFKLIDYNDVDALEKAITPNTAAFLVEPIQGEGGIVVPDENYLKLCFELCQKNNVLFIVDEIQTGLGRTGKRLATDHANIKPDGVILGKALGGGLLPVSMFLSKSEVMDVFEVGDHGSTFGGNPLSCAVAHEAIKILQEEKLPEKAAELGEYLMEQLKAIQSPLITDLRGKGLLIGIEIDSNQASAHDICMKMLDRGLLSKDTHGTVVRLAPPLIITKEEIDHAVGILKEILEG